MTPIATKGINKNVEAFLMLITYTEGTDRQGTPYNELFGYDNFSDYSRHPNIRRYFVNPKTNKRDFSTAAGRYQINKPTYDRLKMKSFTPETQDAAAIELIKQAGAYNDVVSGNFEKAIRKTNKVWASLPYSPYEQPTYSMKAALAFIAKYAAPAALSLGGLFLIGFLIYFINQK